MSAVSGPLECSGRSTIFLAFGRNRYLPFVLIGSAWGRLLTAGALRARSCLLKKEMLYPTLEFGFVVLMLLYVCCIGIKSSSRGDYDMLWLWLSILFLIISPGAAVCESCWGDASGCQGVTDQCPWIVVLAGNVAAVTSASGTVITLEKILPAKYIRLFSRQVLQVLTSISAKPRGGVEFSYDGKSGHDIYKAVKSGYVAKDEAVSEILSRIDEQENGETPDQALVKSLERTIKVIQGCAVTVSHTEVSEGVFLFVIR